MEEIFVYEIHQLKARHPNSSCLWYNVTEIISQDNQIKQNIQNKHTYFVKINYIIYNTALILQIVLCFESYYNMIIEYFKQNIIAGK